jgi:hypothetical protein
MSLDEFREVGGKGAYPGIRRARIEDWLLVIKLPDFYNTRCLYFQACGRLLGKATAEDAAMVAPHTMRAGRAYIRFLAGGQKKNHLHVDLALATIFPRGRRPRVNARKAEILRQLSAHKGEELEILLLGRYMIDIKEANIESGLLFTGPRSVVSTVNNAAIEVIGARLAVRNDKNIEMIQWDVFGTEALIDIYGTCKAQVSDDYLIEAFALAENAFATYIIGKPRT